MFNKEKGFFHGWVEGMTEHPEFYWARANGWAFMTSGTAGCFAGEPSVATGNSAILKAHAKVWRPTSLIGILASVAETRGLLSDIGDAIYTTVCACYQSRLIDDLLMRR
jgi:hypothetical protein